MRFPAPDMLTAWGTIAVAVATFVTLRVTTKNAKRDRRDAAKRLADSEAERKAEAARYAQRLEEEVRRADRERTRQMQLDALMALGRGFIANGAARLTGRGAPLAGAPVGELVYLAHMLPREVATVIRRGLQLDLDAAQLVIANRYAERAGARSLHHASPDVFVRAALDEVADDVDVITTGVPSWAMTGVTLATSRQDEASVRLVQVDPGSGNQTT